MRNFAVIYLVSPSFIRRARNEKCMDYFIRICALRSLKIVQMYAPIVVHFGSQVTPAFDEKRRPLFQRLLKSTLYNKITRFLRIVLQWEGVCGILAEVTVLKQEKQEPRGVFQHSGLKRSCLSSFQRVLIFCAELNFFTVASFRCPGHDSFTTAISVQIFFKQIQ